MGHPQYGWALIQYVLRGGRFWFRRPSCGGIDVGFQQWLAFDQPQRFEGRRRFHRRLSDASPGQDEGFNNCLQRSGPKIPLLDGY